MGMSNMWRWAEDSKPRPFPKLSWALELDMEDFPYPREHHGQWFWEGGFDKDPLHDAEGIRDWNLRAVYGAFNAMKNTSFLTGGTVDDCIRYWRGIFDQAPFEYITLIWHFAQQPKDLVLEEMQLFMEKVVPELDVPDYAIAAE